jgi:hypothetical protein
MESSGRCEPGIPFKDSKINGRRKKCTNWGMFVGLTDDMLEENGPISCPPQGRGQAPAADPIATEIAANHWSLVVLLPTHGLPLLAKIR